MPLHGLLAWPEVAQLLSCAAAGCGGPCCSDAAKSDDGGSAAKGGPTAGQPAPGKQVGAGCCRSWCRCQARPREGEQAQARCCFPQGWEHGFEAAWLPQLKVSLA